MWIELFQPIAHSNYTYKTFMDYLSVIQSNAKTYWKSLNFRNHFHKQVAGGGGDMLSDR